MSFMAKFFHDKNVRTFEKVLQKAVRLFSTTPQSRVFAADFFQLIQQQLEKIETFIFSRNNNDEQLIFERVITLVFEV